MLRSELRLDQIPCLVLVEMMVLAKLGCPMGTQDRSGIFQKVEVQAGRILRIVRSFRGTSALSGAAKRDRALEWRHEFSLANYSSWC